jgi:rhodanese-related sulfurtransferase
MTSIATPDEIKAALAHDNAVVIDVRKEEEIQESGRFETDRKWFNASGTPEENEILEQHAEQWIPNKHGKR